MEQGKMPVNPGAIILAGVHWGRDSVLERALPRPLLPIANRPLIEHILNWLYEGGVGSVSVCANSDTRMIRRYLGNGEPQKPAIHYYEDHMPRGPAGCVRDAALEREYDTLIVIDGTIIPQTVDLQHLLEAHAQSDAAMTVVVTSPDQGAGKNGACLAPVGIYIFTRSVLEHIAADGYQDIKETLIPHLYKEDELVGMYRVEDHVPQVRDTASCLAANLWLAEHTIEKGLNLKGYRRVADALVHESARVDGKALLVGPMLIGPCSMVERGATVIGPTIIGASCRISQGALVCRSVLWDGAQIERDRILDRCIFTNHAKV
jgi:NDP-sugar pyrophosphorylase family protein